MKKVRPTFLIILLLIGIPIVFHKTIGRAIRYEYTPTATFHLEAGDTKCLPEGKMIFRIAYSYYHRAHGLAKIPDGGIPWKVAAGQKCYLYVPGRPLEEITGRQYEILSKLTLSNIVELKNNQGEIFKLDTGGGCRARIVKTAFFPGENIRGAKAFLVIDDQPAYREQSTWGHIVPSQREISFDQLTLPDPGSYRGYWKQDAN